MKRFIPLLLGLAGAVQAACPAHPSNVACIQLTPPTTNTDNTPVVGPLKFNYMRQVGPPGQQGWIVQVQSANTFVLVSGLPLGQHCFAATAVDALNRESAMSNTTCIILRLPAPTDGSIEAPSNGSIEFPKP